MSEHDYAHLVRRVSLLATSLAISLLIIKSVAYYLTGSASILASQVDSLMDIGMSLVNLFAVRYALRPPDNEHRFGHGKAEPIAGMVQAGFICGTSIILLYTGFASIGSPAPLSKTGVGLMVMVVSTVATAALVLYQLYVVKCTGNSVIKADSLHYSIDILMNISVILALLLDQWGMHWADGVFTIAIALYVLHSAWGIGHEALQNLLDRELDDQTKEQILKIVYSVALVKGVHDVRTRQSGQIIFIQLHIELDDDLSLLHAHDVSVEVENELRKRWPTADILVHLDPLSIVDEELKLGHQFS